ncbi:MAG: DEAD/DEAH box helicase [Candidatus Thermoplasmatota archaeon]|nr:DEAD/DEAH box helicase [Candidatus Thermoplasmatota archaeon]
MRVSNLGLPNDFLQVIDGNDFELYPHQERSVTVIEGGRNLILSVPTASGKTLVAYIAIYRNFLKQGRCIYIVPLKALASEKFEELKKLRGLGLKVGISVSDYDEPPDALKRYDVLICTSEKADSFFHHDPSIMFELTLIVADELHLVGDPGRGSKLEMFLTAARYLNPDIRIIGLSATISNSDQLSAWLDADPVISDFRPVELHKGVIYQGHLSLEEDEDIVLRKKMELEDACRYFIDRGGQVIVFLNSRKRAEDTAAKLSLTLGISLTDQTPAESEESQDRYARALASTMPKGVAFHHAGLSGSDRTKVEQYFRDSRIKVIAATPTLAAGVNLPARAVIVRDITRFSDGGVGYISNTEVNQMLGRAGRPKYDRTGYGIIYAANPSSLERVREYFNGEPEPVVSNIGDRHMIRFNTLALVSTGLGSTLQDIMNFYQKTLLAVQQDTEKLKPAISDSLEFLTENEMIRVNGSRYTVSKIGKMVSDLYIDPESAVLFLDFLKEENVDDVRTIEAISMAPDIFPVSCRNSEIEMVEQFFETQNLRYYELEDFHSRIKTAMILMDWINEVDISEICDRYSIGPGDIQSRISSAEWMAHSLGRLSSMIRPQQSSYFQMMALRIGEGIKGEIFELTTVPNIGRVRARRLYNSGIKTLEELAAASVDQLKRIAGFSDRLSQDTIDHALTLMRRR